MIYHLTMTNPNDLMNDDSLWNTFWIIAAVASLLLSMLYFDRYKRWSATRAERQKAAQWNRPKS